MAANDTRRVPRAQKRIESCPLCGDDVWPATAQTDTGVPWGQHHHAHALCALENLAARVAELERILVAIHGPQQR